jgi:hypothetical protein
MVGMQRLLLLVKCSLTARRMGLSIFLLGPAQEVADWSLDALVVEETMVLTAAHQIGLEVRALNFWGEEQVLNSLQISVSEVAK